MRESAVRNVSSVMALIGVVGLLCGAAVTPSLAERYLTPDNHMAPRELEILRQSRMIAVVLGACMVVGGSALFLMAPALSDYAETGYLEDESCGMAGRDQTVTRTTRRSIALGLIVLAGVGASLWMLWITDNGPGVNPDSVTFIETARNLLAGKGFSAAGEPMTHFPPAYPILLSAAGLLRGGNVVQGARLLAVLLFGVNVSLVGLAVAMCTEYSLSATSCAVLFTSLSAPTLFEHSRAMSEAPFITFSMGALILASLHVARSGRYWHISASLLASLAIATRYVGVTLLPPMAFGLLILSDRPIKRRIKETLVSLSLASLPLALWLLRNVVIAQTATNRTFAVHLVDLGLARALARTVYQFILPIAIPMGGRAFSFVLVSGVFLLGVTLLYRKSVGRQVGPVALAFIGICVAFSSIYVAFLTISISFFDAQTPVDSRILLPVLLPMTAAGISLARSLSRALDRRFIWSSFVFLVLLSISFNGLYGLSTAVQIHRYGSDYTSRAWQDSETISYLQTTDDSKKIYSNGHDVVRFITDKEAIAIPAKTDRNTLSPNKEYEDELRKVLRECREGEALIVYLDGITWRWYLPSTEELECKGNLPLLRRTEDGVVYGRR